ncbi:MAG: 3-dehydroquinate synthase [Balneolaceae bacterium]
MSVIKQQFSVPFQYDVIFTDDIFNLKNDTFRNLVLNNGQASPKSILCVLDENMFEQHPDLFNRIQEYARQFHLHLIQSPVVIPGGEPAKNDPGYVEEILQAINETNIDRHSYVMAIGGGAVIDTAGYAAGIAHRGIRIIRVPTTVLAQNDASVGVKNGVNAFGKKNFLGTFVPPFAVINDSGFLTTLEQRDWISGISEAIKVALLKDSAFFDFIKNNAAQLRNRDIPAMKRLIHRCAELHLEHISTNGDPFEMGSSRPLDFGHWAAHKLEQLTNYKVRHGEAVAIGIALDVTYSRLQNMISENDWKQILDVLKNSGFRLFVPELQNKPDQPEHDDSIMHGLQEFREHLGGQLTIMLLEAIGKGIEVHKVDFEVYKKAVKMLKELDSVSKETLKTT